MTQAAVRVVPADVLTPIGAFAALAQPQASCLLESVESGGRISRYSFIGLDYRAAQRFESSKGSVRARSVVLSRSSSRGCERECRRRFAGLLLRCGPLRRASSPSRTVAAGDAGCIRCDSFRVADLRSLYRSLDDLVQRRRCGRVRTAHRWLRRAPRGLAPHLSGAGSHSHGDERLAGTRAIPFTRSGSEGPNLRRRRLSIAARHSVRRGARRKRLRSLSRVATSQSLAVHVLRRYTVRRAARCVAGISGAAWKDVRLVFDRWPVRARAAATTKTTLELGWNCSITRKNAPST